MRREVRPEVEVGSLQLSVEPKRLLEAFCESERVEIDLSEKEDKASLEEVATEENQERIMKIEKE